ncbi:MAG: glycerophosphodiester phosphodiesterase [Actinomycetota bacterium]
MSRPLLGAPTLVFAHRGDRLRAPDNTLDAYMLAVDAGTDGIELDVRRTRDGILILSHDDHVPGLEPFASLGFEVVRELAPQVPTLREAMNLIPRHIFVNVEIKNFSFDAGYDENRMIVDQTIAELREYDDPSRIIMSSFDPLSVQRVGEVGSEFLRGQLLLAVFPLDAGIAVSQDLEVDAVIPHLSHLKDDPVGTMDQIREADLATIVWGVDTDEEIELMGAHGVDIIITDDPGRAKELLNQA